mgnify:CR=1 FL=1
MRIALAQIAAGTDPDANLATVAEHTARAAADGAQLVVFPEATMCRFGTSLREIAEPFDGRWADGVRAVADEHGVTVVAGMFCPAGDGRITNTLLATGGGVAARYDKIHLYDAFGFTESRTVAPGGRAVLIEVDGVTVGLTTCYDIRFPELYVELARRGATLITVSASWGAGPGKAEQWTLLARARALDVGGYVAAVDRPVAERRGRVIARPRAQKGYVTLDLCLAEGLDRGRKVTRSMGPAFKEARHLSWGSPLGEVVADALRQKTALP